MKSNPMKRWRSIMPIHISNKSATRFCMFPKVKSMSYSPGNTPVYLNVYDLTPVNGYVFWTGLGVFHSGVEVDGVEYAFGFHDFPTSGVFEVEPKQCPGFKFRKSIFMGTTALDPFQIREFMEYQASQYIGDTYHMIVKNCNHFCDDICFILTGKPIPKWVNRLAKIGSICNCILPENLKTSSEQHDDRQFEGYENEKSPLRSKSSKNCFPSISFHHTKEVSLSSLFLHSHYKGCLPTWQFTKWSKKDSMMKKV